MPPGVPFGDCAHGAFGVVGFRRAVQFPIERVAVGCIRGYDAAVGRGPSGGNETCASKSGYNAPCGYGCQSCQKSCVFIHRSGYRSVVVWACCRGLIIVQNYEKNRIFAVQCPVI